MAMMVRDIVQTQDLADWKLEFMKRFVQHGKFERGEIAGLMREIANMYEAVTEKMVENFHYKEFKNGKVPQLELLRQKFIDEAKADKRKEKGVQAEVTKTNVPAAPKAELEPKAPKTELTKPVEMTPDELKRLIELDPDKFVIKDGDYKKGRMVEIRVIDVREYGAIVETTDGYHTRGLIHNSEIQAGDYVNNANKYFKYGDTMRALIIEWEERKNRLRLSTRNLPMKELPYISAVVSATQPLSPKSEEEILAEGNPPVNPMADKLAALKDQIVTAAPVIQPAAPANPPEAPAVVVTESAPEREVIKGYLNGIVGAVTPTAEEMMVNMIKKHGVFKFTMALTKATDDFKPDLGVILMKEIDSKIGVGL